MRPLAILLLALLLLVSPAAAADPGFYRAGDGILLGTGTGSQASIGFCLGILFYLIFWD